MNTETTPGGFDWERFYQATSDLPLHPLWDRIDPELPRRGLAIELGYGAGAGVRRLIDRGLDVLAIEQSPEAERHLRPRIAPEEARRVQVVRGSFANLRLRPGTADVAIAMFSLFFMAPAEFERFWPRLVACLKPGALFAGQLLGPRDDWRDRGCALHSAAAVDDLMRPFNVIYREEAERPGQTVLGEPKYWHVHHLVARKAAGASQ